MNNKICAGCKFSKKEEIEFNKNKNDYVCMRIKQGKNKFKVIYWCSLKCCLEHLKNKMLTDINGS